MLLVLDFHHLHFQNQKFLSFLVDKIVLKFLLLLLDNKHQIHHHPNLLVHHHQLKKEKEVLIHLQYFHDHLQELLNKNLLNLYH
tara:strand:+ start:288 stop:539 length:252 start_codon:yes stop_codon:yes gene_type:complete